MNIGVDIRVLTDKKYSGVSWHVLELLSAILAIDKDNRYFLYYNSFHDLRSRLPLLDNSVAKIVSTKFPNKVFNYFLQKIFRWPKLDVVVGGSSDKMDLFWLPHINFSSISDGCKKVLTIHDLSFLIYPEFFSFRKNLWHRSLGLRRLVKESDVVVAISDSTKNDIMKIFDVSEDKIRVIPPGVDSRFVKKELCELEGVKEKYKLPEKFIFNIGNLEPRKNIAGLIRAFDSVADKVDDYYLVLAGGVGWRNREILSTIDKSKNREKIKVLGYIDDVDRPALYNLAKLFTYPSFYEGFGLPILEAMACGCPVVTGNASSLSEAAGDAALLVDINNEKAIEEALMTLINDGDLRCRLSEKGLEQAKRFKWVEAAEKYLEVFKK